MITSHGPTMVFEPGEWTVELQSGAEIVLRADGFADEGGMHRFTVLMSGDPDFEMEIARIPSELVADVFGGPAA